jgi:AcrR family transcriptional regulator
MKPHSLFDQLLAFRGANMRKQPRQQRSKLMVEAILQAAAETFAKLGYAHTTTNKIAERAGVSVGSLYQYFPDKDSLLEALLAGHHQQLEQILRRALADLADDAVSLSDTLHRLLTDLSALHQRQPALTKALSQGVLAQSSLPNKEHEDDHAQIAVLARLLAQRTDVRRGDYTAMALVLREAIAPLTRWLAHELSTSDSRSDEQSRLPREKITQQTAVEEVHLMLLRYLSP